MFHVAERFAQLFAALHGKTEQGAVSRFDTGFVGRGRPVEKPPPGQVLVAVFVHACVDCVDKSENIAAMAFEKVPVAAVQVPVAVYDQVPH